MSAYKEMTMFKEADYKEAIRESDCPVMRESDDPKMSSKAEINDNIFSDSADIFDAAFKNFGFAADSAETIKNKDYSDYLMKDENGKYYDKETGKSFESIEAWEKAQEILAKRYDSTAKFFEDKAKKEWARFKNAEENGESDAEKWNHYRDSQEYYAKAKECKEKSKHIEDKLGIFSEI